MKITWIENVVASFNKTQREYTQFICGVLEKIVTKMVQFSIVQTETRKHLFTLAQSLNVSKEFMDDYMTQFDNSLGKISEIYNERAQDVPGAVDTIMKHFMYAYTCERQNYRMAEHLVKLHTSIVESKKHDVQDAPVNDVDGANVDDGADTKNRTVDTSTECDTTDANDTKDNNDDDGGETEDGLPEHTMIVELQHTPRSSRRNKKKRR